MSLAWTPDPIPRFRFVEGPLSIVIEQEWARRWNYKVFEEDGHGPCVVSEGWEESEEKVKASAEHALRFYKDWKKQRGERIGPPCEPLPTVAASAPTPSSPPSAGSTSEGTRPSRTAKP